MKLYRGTFHRSATCVLALCAGLLFGPGELDAEGLPTSLKCTFDNGTTRTLENGAFKTSQPKPLSFAISDINLENQTASLVGTARQTPGALKIVRAINANHFIEIVNEGYMNLTTVYDADAKTGRHPAVHSRHLGILGQPIVAQYTGSCTKEDG